MPLDLAKLLGLTIGKEQDTAGIGGSVKAYKAHVRFEIKGNHERYPLTLPVLVLEREIRIFRLSLEEPSLSTFISLSSRMS